MKRTIIALIIGIFCFIDTPLFQEQADLVDLSRTEYTQQSFKVAHTEKEEKCLTDAIYYEAGNQSEIGKEAVALVIMNRVGAKGRPKSICGVVQQAHIIEDRKTPST